MSNRWSRRGLEDAPASWRWTEDQRRHVFELYQQLPQEARPIYFAQKLNAQLEATADVTNKLRQDVHRFVASLLLIAGMMIGAWLVASV